MFKSIRVKITVSLLCALIIVGGIVGSIAFYDTYRETRKLQDEQLRQIAAFISSDAPLPKNSERGNKNVRIFVYFIAYGENSVQVKLPDNLTEDFYTFRKKGDVLTLVKDKNRQNFLYDLKHAGDLYRAYIRPTERGNIVVVQENEYREELALHAVWVSLLPLLILLPILGFLIFWIVKRTMKPVERLSKSLLQRTEQNLIALPTEQIPTEIMGFVQAINQLLGRIDTFMRQQKRFIADAAHELRSPMTVLSLQADCLNNQSLPAKTKLQIMQLNEGIRRSRNLLEQLLSLARSQNKDRKHQTMLNLHSIFSRVIEDVYPLAEQKSQDIGVISVGNPSFYANETDIYLLIKTLVDNAIRYSAEGAQIDLSAVENDEILEIFVEDNGNGIPVEERERVLDPFYRILGSDQQGSGLGLAIANQIVQNYQGRIELLDSPHFTSGLMVKIIFKKTA
ncbi:ATP-binding protein [Basfia succiniciproducens]|uniref:ATP-binding protein n=1 Tax=Basfia succiniciproducens TaxID=653940 RepID=UPI003FCCE196